MKCKLCSSNNIVITYKGKIRNGALGKYTLKDIEMYRCNECGVIWHEKILENKSYYESQEYRQSLEGTSEEENFYQLHDKESLDKFRYTGTTIFRNKVVSDIGCGCGAFLDYISGVAKKVIAIEPSEKYRTIMQKKGFCCYAYSEDAKKDYKNKVDVVTSFDVIEHVENPELFISDVYDLLPYGGKAIIGTPTEAPVMRELLGEVYEKKLLFSTQHLWILSGKNMEMMAKKCGFRKIRVKYFQRYGIDNLLGWIRDKQPKAEIKGEFITDTLNSVWKSQLGEKGLADYVVLYLEK